MALPLVRDLPKIETSPSELDGRLDYEIALAAANVASYVVRQETAYKPEDQAVIEHSREIWRETLETLRHHSQPDSIANMTPGCVALLGFGSNDEFDRFGQANETLELKRLDVKHPQYPCIALMPLKFGAFSVDWEGLHLYETAVPNIYGNIVTSVNPVNLDGSVVLRVVGFGGESYCNPDVNRKIGNTSVH